MKVLFCAYRDWAVDVYTSLCRHPRIGSMTLARSMADIVRFIEIADREDKKYDLIALCGWSWQLPKELCEAYLVISEHPAHLDVYSLGTPIQNQINDGITRTKHRLVKVGFPELEERLYLPSCEVDMSLIGNMDDVLHEMASTAKTIYTFFFDEYPNIEWRQWPKAYTEYRRPRDFTDSKIQGSEFANMSTRQIYDRIRMLESPYPNAYIEDDEGIVYFERVTYRQKKPVQGTEGVQILRPTAKPVIYDIVDAVKYVQETPSPSTITRVLDASFDVKRIEVKDLVPGMVPEGSMILSRLKLRTLVQNVSMLTNVLPKRRRLFLYEQDTWSTFIMDGPFKDSYRNVFDALNPTSFLVASHFWAGHVRRLGIPCVFVQPWIHPDACVDEPIPWDAKQYDVSFCGSVYPLRVKFFEELNKRDVHVETFNMLKRDEYFEVLKRSRIAIRPEPGRFDYDLHGEIVNMTTINALWLRDIEAASQGCISMREMDDEYVAWGLDHIPTIKTFNDLDDAAMKIKDILTTPAAIHDVEARQALTAIRCGPHDRSLPFMYLGYTSIVNAINALR